MENASQPNPLQRYRQRQKVRPVARAALSRLHSKSGRRGGTLCSAPPPSPVSCPTEHRNLGISIEPKPQLFRHEPFPDPQLYGAQAARRVGSEREHVFRNGYSLDASHDAAFAGTMVAAGMPQLFNVTGTVMLPCADRRGGTSCCRRCSRWSG